MITRKLGETDDGLRARIDAHEAKFRLRNLLRKLGVKSARSGLSVNFAGLNVRVPGVYTNIKKAEYSYDPANGEFTKITE